MAMENNNSTTLYQLWLQKATEDPDLQDELQNIRADEAAIQDRFYRSLAFGTGGLRGVIGAGTNRMNIYTVRKATQGLANYLWNQTRSSLSAADFRATNRADATITALPDSFAAALPDATSAKFPAVAIAYDSRIKSALFAWQAAAVLAANGITAHIFPDLTPTPILSFAVRQLGCQAGIVITASHNPAAYNGYKCYGPDGCQITDAAAAAILSEIEALDLFRDIKTMDDKEALAEKSIQVIPFKVMDTYLNKVLQLQIHPDSFAGTDFSVVYTPLHGAGRQPVSAILDRAGLHQVFVVPEQAAPDGTFPTCPYPNPEIKAAFARALHWAAQKNPDLLLATDPDADRVGIAVRKKIAAQSAEEAYQLMSGNEVGCLLLYYMLTERKAKGTLPPHPLLIKTIVTSALGDRIARDLGCEVINVLTGFKYIGEQIGLLEAGQNEDRFLIGFEESYGYLAGSFVRDKDAVIASLLICEMAAFYKNQGKTLIEVMTELYERYGYYRHELLNYEFKGQIGLATMQKIMAGFRRNPPCTIAGSEVTLIADYLNQNSRDSVNQQETAIHLPKSDVLAFELADGCRVVIRPSGTEPKIKLYLTAKGQRADEAETKLSALNKAVQGLME